MDFSTLTAGQRQTVTTLDKPLFVAAGAGSGKTFTLTNRVVWALTPGSGEGDKPFLESLDQALIITFTRAAAEEIKERIRGSLQKAGMEDAALQVDDAWISTIHGMCARILRAHAYDLGIDPEFVMMSDVAAQQYRELAIEHSLSEVQHMPEFKALFDAHSARGTRGDGPMSVAGMVDTLLSAIASAPHGEASLVWHEDKTDWTSAFNSLRRRYEELLATSQHKYPEAETAILDAVETIEHAFSQAGPSSRNASWAAELMVKLEKPNGKFWRANASKEAYKACDNEFKYNECLVALCAEAELKKPLLKLAKMVSEKYEEGKRERCALDNDDLLRMAMDALETHPEIAAAYSNKFHLVMVDEFQDTSEQQVKMISLLSGKDACHLTTVGDAQQSIYRFRGADVDVFRRREAQMPEELRPQMAENFRSHDDILRFVRQVCDHGNMIPGFMDLRAGRDESKVPNNELYHNLSLPRVCVELTINRKSGNKAAPGENWVATAALQVADRLATLHKQGVPLGDMALLLGRMKNTSVYVQALRAYGLECVVTGGSTFSATEEVGIVSSLLNCLADPHSSADLFTVLTSEMFELDANDMTLLATQRREDESWLSKRPLENGMVHPEFVDGHQASQRLQHALDTLRWGWSQVGVLDPADVLRAVVERSGWLHRLELRGAEGRSVAANVLAAVEYVRDLYTDDQLGVAGIAEEFSLWMQVAKAAPASLVGGSLNAISIMTAHSSKGLEFPVVAVGEILNDPAVTPKSKGVLAVTEGDNVYVALSPGKLGALDVVDEDNFPLSAEQCSDLVEFRAYLEQRDAMEEMAEKARLLYVALTRAREVLIFSVPVKHSTATSAKRTFAPEMAYRVMGAINSIGSYEAGGYQLFYGGSAPSLLRCFVVKPQTDPSKVDSFVLETSDSHGLMEQPKVPTSQANSQFLLFNTAAQEAATVAPSVAKTLKPDVYSYTMSKREEIEIADKPEVLGAHVTKAVATSEATPLGLELVREEYVEGKDDNPDDSQPRATNLGSAFHALAQYTVESGKLATEAQIKAMARTWECTGEQLKRMEIALERWYKSDLRKEVLAYEVQRAEVPFFVKRPGPLGTYLRGAIDLLAYNRDSDAALLVDYKTGDSGKTSDELRESHQDQAQVYASILLSSGFKRVECAFVCVELEDAEGQPIVVRYEFAQQD